ncbi:MAG: hypothetical protein M3246_08490 [Actinomycetota bacterium]|nr:hypothetical protein [Actinomycetota bacterium]
MLAKNPEHRYALVGLAGALSDLGLYKQAAQTFEKAAAGGQKERREAAIELRKMREAYQRERDAAQVRWLDAVLKRIGAG